MPYEKGGRADKKGNKYEINCIVYELLKVLDGSNYSVVIEALGEDEKGTDILVTNHEGKKEHQQCKARNGSSDNWTISDLKARKIFNAWKIQLDRECDRKVALVSPMTCSFLVDLNDRANNTSGKADEFYDFQIMNSSKEFQSFYENFCKEMNIEIGRESGILKSIDYLKRIYYKQISEYEIQELITQNIQYQFSSPKDMVYDAFVSMIVSKDILGRELTQIALIDYIEKKNIKFQLREDDGRIGFRIKELNQEYRESFRTLQEGLIHRKEFDNCIKYIMDGKGVVITGNAGYGKSGCTEAILNFCEDANIPCIAIKLDRRIPHKNCKNWGEELGLPGSIAYCIHTISRNENAIIILDQLDALRWTQSNSSEALSICMELIRQVECLNYNRAKKISIVFVCRTYDFENDNNIRALFENREREEEIWKVIEIGKFEEKTVGRIVGDIYKDLSVKLKSLLQIPSNLYIWQHLDKKQIYGECLTTSNLIDKWFDQICKRSTEVGISSKLVADTTNPVDVVKNLLDHGNKKRISVAAKLEYTDNIKKVTFDNCCYEYDLWDEKGFNIAIDYDEIVGFISLWEYLKRELDVFETEKEVSKSEIELFFRKYEKMTNMSNKTSNYIPIVEEETLRMIDDKLQRKVGDVDYNAIKRNAYDYVEEDIKIDSEQLKIFSTYLHKKILPTPSLTKYVSNRYRTEDEKATRISLIIAIVSIVISICASLFSVYATFKVDPSNDNLKIIQEKLDTIENNIKDDMDNKTKIEIRLSK